MAQEHAEIIIEQTTASEESQRDTAALSVESPARDAVEESGAVVENVAEVGEEISASVLVSPVRGVSSASEEEKAKEPKQQRYAELLAKMRAKRAAKHVADRSDDTQRARELEATIVIGTRGLGS